MFGNIQVLNLLYDFYGSLGILVTTYRVQKFGLFKEGLTFARTGQA